MAREQMPHLEWETPERFATTARPTSSTPTFRGQGGAGRCVEFLSARAEIQSFVESP